MSSGAGTAGKGGRGVLWALLAVTGLPFLAALYLFLNPQLLEGLGSTSHGRIVQPVRPLPELKLQTLDGRGLDLGSLRGSWVLLAVGDSRCGEPCTRNLFYLRQIRRAMGEDRFRVQRVMVLAEGRVADDLAARLRPYEGTRVLTGPDAARARLLDTLRVDAQPLTGRVYIVDPNGNLALAYPPYPEWKDVLDDLQHLLKAVKL